MPASAAEDIALDGYLCADFSRDTDTSSEGPKSLRSLMMIAWTTGYAAAYQRSQPRADSSAIVLIASALMQACRKNPDKEVVKVAVASIDGFVSGADAAATSTGVAAVPSSSSEGKFKIFDNRDIPGVDLRRLQKVDLQSCKAACEPEQSCQAFSYDKWNRWCFLKSGLSPLSLEPSSLVGIKGALPEPEVSKEAVRMDRRPGKSPAGKPYSTGNVQSLDACEANCLGDQKCLAFSFVKASSRCNAYDRVETIGLDAGSISGIKTQNPP